MFVLIEVNEMVVYVILQDGKRDAYFRSYLEEHSHVLSSASQDW